MEINIYSEQYFEDIFVVTHKTDGNYLCEPWGCCVDNYL